MPRLFLSLATLLTLCTASLAETNPFAIPQDTWLRCREGNVQAFSDYVGAPAILVSVYKREILRPEGQCGSFKWVVVYHARVIASTAENIPFGKAVIYKTLHEEAPEASQAMGELIYIVSPSPRSELYWTGEIELAENHNRVPLDGGKRHYEFGRRGVEALKH